MAMRKTVLIAVMLLTTAFAIAQQLERCTLDGFSQTVKNVLIPGYDKACGMVSSPSFDYLSSIMLYPEKRELVYRKAKDNFTGQLAEDQIPVETSHGSLPLPRKPSVRRITGIMCSMAYLPA